MGAWWSPGSSKTLRGGQTISGVFDSHPLRHLSQEGGFFPKSAVIGILAVERGGNPVSESAFFLR